MFHRLATEDHFYPCILDDSSTDSYSPCSGLVGGGESQPCPEGEDGVLWCTDFTTYTSLLPIPENPNDDIMSFHGPYSWEEQQYVRFHRRKDHYQADMNDLSDEGVLLSPTERALRRATCSHDIAEFLFFGQTDVLLEYECQEACVRHRFDAGLTPCPSCPDRLCVIGPMALWEIKKGQEEFNASRLVRLQEERMCRVRTTPVPGTPWPRSFRRKPVFEGMGVDGVEGDFEVSALDYH